MLTEIAPALEWMGAKHCQQQHLQLDNIVKSRYLCQAMTVRRWDISLILVIYTIKVIPWNTVTVVLKIILGFQFCSELCSKRIFWKNIYWDAVTIRLRTLPSPMALHSTNDHFICPNLTTTTISNPASNRGRSGYKLNSSFWQESTGYCTPLFFFLCVWVHTSNRAAK